MIAVLVALLTALVAGLPVALALERRARGTLALGLAFLYGSAVVFAVMLFLSLTGVRWSLPLVMACVIAIATAALVWVDRRSRKAPGDSVERLSRTSARRHPLDALTASIIVAFASFATIARMWEWDFWAIWGLKARVFLEHGGIHWRFLESRWNDFTHPDYPMLLPMNLAWLGLAAGEWNDRWLGLLSVAFGVALVLIVRQLAARELPPAYAAAIGLAATYFGMSRYIGLAEGPLIAFGTAGLLFVRQAIGDDDPIAMRNGAILLGLAASCKNEGIALLVATAVAIILTTRSFRGAVALWPALVTIAPWTVASIVHGLRVDLAVGGVFARAAERLASAHTVGLTLLQLTPDRGVWIGMIAALLVIPAAVYRRERFLLVVVALQLVTFIAIYFATPRDVTWHIGTSWPRLSRQLGAPLSIAILLMLAHVARRGEDGTHGEAGPE